MDAFKANVKGIAELKRAIYELNAKLGQEITRKALRAGANVTLKAARASAPVKTGRLRKAIKIKNSRINQFNRNGKVGVFITISPGKSRKDPRGAYYGKWVENGYNHGSKIVTGAQAVSLGIITRKQLLAKKLEYRGKVSRSKDKWGTRYRHGGKTVAGKYFMKNSFEATKHQAAEVIIRASEIGFRKIAGALGLKVR